MNGNELGGKRLSNTSFAIGWRQVFVAFMLMASTAMIATTWSFISLPLGAEFGLGKNRALLMFSMTILSGTGALLTPVLGNLMDRLSVRWFMVLGGVLLASGYFAISFATSFKQVLLIFGLLIAPANILLGPVASTVLLARWFVEKRGRALGIAIAGVSAGTFVFPRIIQYFLDMWPWREALLWYSLILLLWTVPVALLAIDRPSDRGLNADGGDEPSEAVKADLARSRVSVREVISHPAFWMLALTVAIVTAGMKGMMTNLASIAQDHGISPTDATMFASIYALCGFVGKLNFAALADRLGPRILMFAALGGYAAGMAAMGHFAGGFWSIAGSIGLIGVFGGLMVPIESYIAPRIFGQRAAGRAMGLLAGAIMLALLASPPLFGWISDVTGSYNGMFLAFSGMALLAMLWLPFLRLTARETA